MQKFNTLTDAIALAVIYLACTCIWAGTTGVLFTFGRNQ